AELLAIAERGEEQDGAVLIGEILGVLEGQVEKSAFLRLQLLVELPVDRRSGDGEREMVRRELLRMPAEHVAGKLVEQDHPGERGQRIVEEALNRELALLGPELEEILLDPMVEIGAAAPPLLFREAEPEFEDVG